MAQAPALDEFQEIIMAITRINIQSSPTYMPILPGGLGVGLSRLVNRWVARIIARSAREAASVALRDLGDRDLKDIGIHRDRIGDALTEIACERTRLQRYRQSS
jgi:hypothetical protein